MSVLIITEFGEGVGLGHLSRCKAVAKAVLEQGCACEVVANEGAERAREFYAAGYKNSGGFDTLLLDSYIVSQSDIQRLKKEFKKCATLDDCNRMKYPLDLVIHPSIGFDMIDYSNQSAKVVGGGDYVILRDGILRFRYALQQKKVITITLGGYDDRLLSLLIAEELLKEFGSDYGVNLVLGNSGHQKDAQERFPKAAVYGYVDGGKMAELFLESLFVVSGCGQTLNELAFLQIPTIGVLMAKNQETQMMAYLRAGFLSGAVEPTDGFEKEVVRIIKNGVKPAPKALISGLGAQNIAKALLGM